MEGGRVAINLPASLQPTVASPRLGRVPGSGCRPLDRCVETPDLRQKALGLSAQGPTYVCQPDPA
jgi:hypothetical protein